MNLKPPFDKFANNNFVRLILNLFWVYCAYLICRISFIFVNKAAFSNDKIDYLKVFEGGMLFDTSAICYTNALFILLFLNAGYFKDVKQWVNIALRIVFTVINSLFILLNFIDSVIFTIRLQRSNATTFREFKGEVNVTTVAGGEILSHWYLVILEIIMVVALWKLFIKPASKALRSRLSVFAYSCGFALVIFLVISGMRGEFLIGRDRHPITEEFAFGFTDDAKQTGIVLNTPFTVIRTIKQHPLQTPRYFTEEELATIYSPVHLPDGNRKPIKKNIVIIILESFSGEFFGAMNTDLDGGTYKGYTPFLDQLADSSLWFDEMIANSFFSVDAPPALLASIPRADRPFVVSPYARNNINSLATELRSWGYNTSFFLGADNKSLGINDFVTMAGFENYFGKNEYIADPRFGAMADYDGVWGIWDEPFLQFFCTKLTETLEPFLASLFTISSHHPFRVPQQYKDVFKDEGKFPIHKGIKYTDFALGRFFEEARKQPWFNNTIFVLSADHTSSSRTHAEYKNDMGNLRIPILIYDPSGSLPRGRQPGIIQQIDIMPTILSHLGYDRPYVAFGKDVLSTNPADDWAFSWNYLPVLVKGQYVMTLENGEPVKFYDYKNDPDHLVNLLGRGLPEEKEMYNLIRAIVQSYLFCMNEDCLTVTTSADGNGSH